MRRWRAGFALVSALSVASFADAEPEQARSLGPSALHLPVLEREAERGILTPVPIELDVPEEFAASRVLVHYKIWGSKQWTTLELRGTRGRWSGAIPCLEVSTITGDISYYVRVHDAAGAVVAFSGSRHQPYRVHIVYAGAQTGGAGRCPDPADCPPGLPGCPSEKVERVPCRADGDCEGGLTCGWEGYCELDERVYNWVTLEAEAGLGLVAATGACSVPSQENSGYLCFRESDGATYVGTPHYTNEPLALGSAPLRAVIGFERLIDYQTTLGIRLGYAFHGGGPTARGGSAFMPYSAEIRAAHFFGADPFATEKLLPYGVLAGGYAMYDIHTHVDVREDVTRAGLQGGNDLTQTLEVWKRAGDAYVAAGGGLFIRLRPRLGLSAELRAAQTFPFGATLLLGSLGVRAGL